MTTREEFIDQMVADRRRLHQRPEEGWTEFETMYYVVERLKSLGIPVKTGTDVINPQAVAGRRPEVVAREIERAAANGVPRDFIEGIRELTGAVAVIETGRPGPVTAFRCDMDCVLVDENKTDDHLPYREGFASERPGLMHACGHDGHTAVGLAVAQWLSENREKLCGTFKVLFQPAEEGVRGGNAVAASGILDDVDRIIGAHVGCLCHSGEIGVCEGGFLATSKLDIEFNGKESHAGNDPELGRSAVMAACQAAVMMQGIPRHGKGATRISIGTIHGGTARNVTPAHCEMQIEVRAETNDIHEYMLENIRNIVKAAEVAYGVTAGIKCVGSAGSLICCPETVAEVADVAGALPDVKQVSRISRPMGSEDCTALIKRVVEKGGEGAFFVFGCEHHGHHRGDFDIQDRQNLPVAFDVFTSYALKHNGI